MGEEKFKPTVEWMEENYRKMNEMLFEGELGECILRPFTSGKGSQGGTLGWFKITTRGVRVNRYTRKMFINTMYGEEKIFPHNFFNICQPCIELNANYSWTEHAMLATLVHEMCHYYTYMFGFAPKQGHGAEFKSIGRIVSSRSNGMFTIQRLASAEQMTEMELDQKMQAKNDARLTNQKSRTTALVVYKDNGNAELTTSTNDNLIGEIVNINTTRPTTTKIITTNDPRFIEKIFSLGYRKNMRTYRRWVISQKEDFIEDLKNCKIKILFDRKPNNLDEPKQETPREKKIFTVNLKNGGSFELEMLPSYMAMHNRLKERFPNMSDEVIKKLLNNPNNYKIVKENKDTLMSLIKETVNEYLMNEISSDGNDIEIDPTMNLGMASPLEFEDIDGKL